VQAVWIKSAPGHIGNHVFINGGEWVFDYHGYSAKPRFLAHIWRGARQRWLGWDGTLVELPPGVLISEQKSRTYDGLWLREPGQFLHEAMPRAEAYLDCRTPTHPNGIDLESSKGRLRRPIVVTRTAGNSATRPLPRITAIVSFLDPLPAFRFADGNWSLCPIPAIS
jgi:hypothetical protein